MSVELEVFAARAAPAFRASAEADRLRPETALLRDTVRRFAPRRSGALMASIHDAEHSVFTTSTYAVLQDQGGTVRAKRRGYLLVPIRTSFSPGPGYFTAWGKGRGWVKRTGSGEIVALRLRSVKIRGSGFLSRALSSHLQKAGERIADDLEREAPRG